MMGRLKENDLVSFIYTSGEQAHDAGEWEFQVFGRRGWEAKMVVRGTSALRFSMPLLYVEENPRAYQSLFLCFSRHLKAIHGYGGHGLVLSASREGDNQPFEAYLSSLLNGFDVGEPVGGARSAHQGIKTVSWLTAVNYEMVENVGGMATTRSELPMDWFAFYDYGAGMVVQAGPKPEGAPSDQPNLASLVLLNRLFKDVRAAKISVHNASKNGEPRIIAWGAEQWLKRFDIEDSELMAYKSRLLGEPKLTNASTLPDRL